MPEISSNDYLEILPENTEIKMLSGDTAVVKKHLGGGGQGDVYLVILRGEKYALKWYRSGGQGKDPDAFYQHLKDNIEAGPPTSAFIWPVDLSVRMKGSYGYLMHLRPEGYYDATDFFMAKRRFPSFRILADAAIKIVTAFLVLHNKGYSYQDLNDGNFFLNPETGDVLIADNDNVVADGVWTGILGKPRYMAPEIVASMNQKRPRFPDTYSDRYSMAVILFMLICMGHPLEGRYVQGVMTPEIQEKVYGEHALFVMDKDNPANRPTPGVDDNVLALWPQLPEYMKSLFFRTFGQTGIKKPNTRPIEREWLKGLCRMQNDIVLCECGNEIFTDEGLPAVCDNPSCRRKYAPAYRFITGSKGMALVRGNTLRRCQVMDANPEKALDPVIRVVGKKSDPNVLAMRNVGTESWTAEAAGNRLTVSPGQVAPVMDGMVIWLQNEKIRIEKICPMKGGQAL